MSIVVFWRLCNCERRRSEDTLQQLARSSTNIVVHPNGLTCFINEAPTHLGVCA